MGWFSKHIMGGDESYDAKSKFLHVIGIKDYEDEKEIDPVALESNQHKMLSLSTSSVETQVLGLILMAYGAKMSDRVRAAVLSACDHDEWSKEDLERRILVSEFRDIVESYGADGKYVPTEATINYEARFGITDWLHGRLSSKIATMALYYIHREYKDMPWYKDSTIIVNSSGYAILIGVTNEDKLMESLKSVFGVFEVPVFFCDGSEMRYEPNNDIINRVKYNGDIRIPYVPVETN